MDILKSTSRLHLYFEFYFIESYQTIDSIYRIDKKVQLDTISCAV